MGTREITLSAIDVICTTTGRATKVVVRDVTSWVMKPRIAGAHVLRIRIVNSNNKLHRISSNNSRVTGDAFSVVLKVTSRETAPS